MYVAFTEDMCGNGLAKEDVSTCDKCVEAWKKKKKKKAHEDDEMDSRSCPWRSKGQQVISNDLTYA